MRGWSGLNPDDDQRDPRPGEVSIEGTPGLAYTRDPPREQTRSLLIAYRWPLFISLLLTVLTIAGLWLFADVGPGDLISAIPVQVWSMLFYAGFAAGLSAIPAYMLVMRWETIEGIAVLEQNPVTHDHRHLSVGSSIWSDLVVKSPWGSIASTADLQPCTVNGRSGYELMDFHLLEDGTPCAVATWMGESSGAAFRTYKNAFRYAHNRLAKRANRATMLRANQGQIAREAAERVVYEMIRTSERSGMPHGEEVESVVDDVLSDYALDDPLDDDLEDDRLDLDQGDDQLGDDRADPLEQSPRERAKNGHVAADGGRDE